MKLEDQMLTILRDARTVEMTEKGLTFFDADGKEIQTLVPEVAGRLLLICSCSSPSGRKRFRSACGFLQPKLAITFVNNG